MLMLRFVLIEATSLSWCLLNLDMVQGNSNVSGMFFRMKGYLAASGWKKSICQRLEQPLISSVCS